jgi:hypothetical protein
MTGFVLTDPISANDIKQKETQDTTGSHAPITLWVKEAAYLYNNYDLTIDNSAGAIDASITFYSGNRKAQQTVHKRIKQGNNKISGIFKNAVNPLYVEITNCKGELISNRQFVIPSEIMEVNNPSPESEYKRKRYREIEAGKFINGEVLRFIEQILNDAETKLSAKSNTETIVDKTTEDKDGHSVPVNTEAEDDYCQKVKELLEGKRFLLICEETEEGGHIFGNMNPIEAGLILSTVL